MNHYYKRLTLEERLQIKALTDSGLSYRKDHNLVNNMVFNAG